MLGVPYLVEARILGEKVAGITVVSDEFIADSSEQQFREVMKSFVSEMVEEKFGEGFDFDVTWQPIDPLLLSLYCERESA